MSEPEFTVYGKIINTEGPGGPNTQFICGINDQIWWVPDDMGNIDRQKVQAWIDAGGDVPILVPEDVAKLQGG